MKPNCFVQSIPKHQTKDWLLKKHYAKRVPQIQYAFGLYVDNVLSGVCTYGSPARMLNNGYGLFGGNYEVLTLELNRLVINEDLPKNTLSYFVSQTFKQLPKPCCLVSYADSNMGHCGYIYQATNWMFTGITKVERIYINSLTNEVIHPRTVVELFGTREEGKLPLHIILETEAGGKYRYLQFIGSKKDRKIMANHLVYNIEPYPKGDNNRYDANQQIPVQGLLL